MKIIFALLLGLFLPCIILFVGLQALYIFYIHGISSFHTLTNVALPIFNFGYYNYDQITKLTFWILIVISLVLTIPVLVALQISINGGRSFFSSKYDKTSYSHLLTTWQRIRGTIRVQYNDKGMITRKTPEVWMESLFYPVAKVQNAWCNLRHLPEPKRWNTRKTFVISGQKQHHIGGIPIIAFRKYLLFGKYNKIYYIPGKTHNMFVGMTGRGKSMSYVLPMLTSFIHANENIVVHDTKHELLAYTKPILEQYGYKVIVINFDDPRKGDGWNPLQYPYDQWKKAQEVNKETGEEPNVSRAVEMILDIARTIAFEEDAKQPYFWQAAASMIAGAAQLLFEEGKDEYINFKSVKYIFEIGDDAKNGTDTTIAKFLRKYRAIDAGSASKMKTYLESEGITKSSIKSVFNNKMDLLTATQDIIEMTSHSTFNITDIFKEKTAVFLLTQDEKSTYYPLVTMFFKQLYEAGIRVTKENPEGRVLPIPMHWEIDEMAILPEIMEIENMYGAARSRGLSIDGFIQSPAQLIDKYETQIAKIIMDNNTNVIYLGSGTREVQDYFVEKAGKELIYDKNQKKYIERNLLTADRLRLMEKGRTLHTAVEWNPYIVKLPQFSEYTFATKPDWNLKEVIKPAVKFFNIKEENERKQNATFENHGLKKVKFNKITGEIE